MLSFFKQKDKQKHLLVSFVLVFIVGVLFNNVAISVAIGLIVGMLKELYDSFTETRFFNKLCKNCTKGEADGGDIIADSIGVSIALIVLLLLGVPYG